LSTKFQRKGDKDMNEKIKPLLKKKDRDGELERYLCLYEKIDDFIEEEPTVLDRIKTMIKPQETSALQSFYYVRNGMPDCEISITVYCSEVMHALRDYYERKIIELAEDKSREAETASKLEQ
jgi:hypothetical protein